jgi:peptidyl-prolyl cis-trans isomerase B (cyclophilin B)
MPNRNSSTGQLHPDWYPTHSDRTLRAFASDFKPISMHHQQSKGNQMPVVLKTNKGDITLELDSEAAPITVENFLTYAREGHYNGTIFHRVIPDFMIQGGGFTPAMNQKKTKASIKNESNNGLSNLKYSIAMARTSVPDSATSQFFINTKDNFFLDRKSSQDGVGYCVFGRVTSGTDVVDAIGKVKTTSVSGHRDVPSESVEILSVEIVD